MISLVLKTVRCLYLYLSYGWVLRKNRVWHKKRLGGEVNILANGPSLNLVDLDKLKKADCITMNNFDKCSWKDEVNIVAHCIGEPIQSSHWGKDQWNIVGKVIADSYWFDYTVRSDIEKWNERKTVYYVMATLSEELPGIRKVDLCKPILGFSTTAQMAIMIAMYMGYSKIKLHGFDHDMLANRNLSPHFYDDDGEVRVVDYTDTPYIEIMNRTIKMWKRYIVLQKIALNQGIKIINCTKNSYLDVFERGE